MGDASLLMICGGGASCHHENGVRTIQCRANCQWCTLVITVVIPAMKTQNNKKQSHQAGRLICVRQNFMFLNILFLHLQNPLHGIL